VASLHIVNPGEADHGQFRYRANRSMCRYVLWFGSCAPTYVMVWAHGIESALETAAEYISEHAPGLLISDDEMTEALQEAGEEHGVNPDAIDWSDLRGDCAKAVEQAEADTTYTESGRIRQDEWGVMFDEYADRADIKAWIADLEERHYGDGPAVLHPGNATVKA
jgi:hypothetical protein